MAKRFTDTEIWDKEWFMALSPKHKCLIRYIFDKCDAAGIWSPNWILASACIGEKVTEEDLSVLSNQVEKLDGGKFFIPDFVEFQYGALSENCKPHQKVIAILKKHGLYEQENERVTKGYTKGIQYLQEKEKEKEEDKDKEKENTRAKKKNEREEIEFELYEPEYVDPLKKWFEYRKNKNKKWEILTQSQADFQYKELLTVSKNDPVYAAALVVYNSNKGYQTFYDIPEQLRSVYMPNVLTKPEVVY